MSPKNKKKKDYLILLVLSCIISFFSSYIYFSSENDELEEIKGVYNSFDYIERTTNTTSKMKLNFKNESYVIPTYLSASFKINDFKRDIFKGDSISIYLDTDGFINQIKKNNSFYIDAEKRDNLLEKNNNASLTVGLIFLIISVYSLVMLYKFNNS